jgi:hypothetical protein
MQRCVDFACLVAAFVIVASRCPAQTVGEADLARRKALEEADTAEPYPRGVLARLALGYSIY